MRPLSNTFAKKFFGGPLNSFAAKADVAFALKFMEKSTWSDLKVIKDIRNAFAHTSSRLQFSSDGVFELFKRFEPPRPSGVDFQEFFDERAKHASQAIDAKIDEL
jgi:hypothetical protein